MDNRGSISVFYSSIYRTVTCAYVFTQLYLAPSWKMDNRGSISVFIRLSYRTVTCAYVFTQLYLAPQLEDGQPR